MKLATVLLFVIGAGLWISVAPNPVLSQTPCQPHIDSIAPAEGQLGSLVTLLGSCFGPSPGKIVSDAQIEASASGWTGNSIVVAIFAEQAGSIPIAVQTDAGQSNEVEFTLWNYTLPVPGSNCAVLPGDIFIRVAPETSAYDVATAHGDTVIGMSFPGSKFWSIKVPEGLEIAKVKEYASDPSVEWAEPDTGCALNDPTPSPSPPPTPSPTPSPAATPAALPKTGGPPTP
jgi:hypothetical protein